MLGLRFGPRTAAAARPWSAGRRPGRPAAAAAAASAAPPPASRHQQPPQQPEQQSPPLPPEIKAVLFSQADIAAAVARMGREISDDYAASGAGDELVVCGVLTGAFVFCADLARAISPGRKVRVDFLRASSYGPAAESSGDVRVSGMGGDGDGGDNGRWRGKRVLLVEDIIDSGATLRRLADELRSRGALEVRVAALIDKKARRKFQDIGADYVGFADCPDEFVVGYGLDYNEAWRTLPYVGALREEVYTPGASVASASSSSSSGSGSDDGDEGGR